MNEDYLWDKTGSDPEIQKLENALRGFGYRETSPPQLPAKVVAFNRKPSLMFFRYGMAAAACLVFFAATFGIWLQFFSGPDKVSIDPADRLNDTQTIHNPAAKDPGPPKSIGDLKPPSKRSFTEASRPAPHIKNRNIAKAQNSRLPKPAVKLTKEEEFAYEQLKLALSITGSKLKLIKDKVESGDDKNIVLKDGR